MINQSFLILSHTEPNAWADRQLFVEKPRAPNSPDTVIQVVPGCSLSHPAADSLWSSAIAFDLQPSRINIPHSSVSRNSLNHVFPFQLSDNSLSSGSLLLT